MARLVLQPKQQGATVNVSFNFSSQLGTTETLTGTPTVVATVWTGTDPTPSAIVSGAAAISGQNVTQLITAGVVGVVYQLVATVNTSLSQVLQQTAYLYVESAVP